MLKTIFGKANIPKIIQGLASKNHIFGLFGDGKQRKGAVRRLGFSYR